MSLFIRDLSFSIRALLKRPGFTLFTILTLGLGIGAVSLMFGVVHAVILNPLPFKDSERIVGLRETLPDEGPIPLSYRTFAEARDRNTVFENLAGGFAWNVNLESDGDPVRVTGSFVTPNYFSVMGVQPVLGRAFVAGDDSPSAERVVILSHGLWIERYGAAPDVIGKALVAGGRKFTVVGVMPPAVNNQHIGWTSLWTPAVIDDAKGRDNPGRYLSAWGKLKPDATLDQARVELAGILESVKREHPETHNQRYGVSIQPLLNFVVPKQTQTGLWILFASVGCVLLIACADATNLFLDRAVGRSREIGIRFALGAGRARIVGLLMTESLLVSTGGGVVGLAAVQAAGKLLALLPPDEVPRIADFNAGLPLFGFVAATAAFCGLAASLFPVFEASRLNTVDLMKTGSSGTGDGPRIETVGRVMIVGQVALTCSVLIAAGLLFKSFLNLNSVKPGFDVENVLTAEINLPGLRFPDKDRRVDYYRRTIEAVGKLPGVASVSAVQSPPLRQIIYTDPVFIEGRPEPSPGQEPFIRQNVVTSDYFRGTGIPLRQGRAFTERETWENSNVVIVNRAFAERFWPGADPLGKRMKTGPDKPWLTVVGVVENVVQNSLESPTIEEMFYPYVNPAETLPLVRMILVVRTAGRPDSLIQPMRAELKRIDPSIPLSNVTTLRTLADQALLKPKLNSVLTGLFGGSALFLACVGVYGPLSSSMKRRTREIGIRMALGADRRDIFKLTVFKGMAPVGVGIMVGLGIASAAGPYLGNVLFGLGPFDPTVFAVVPLILIAVAYLACRVPATRASRIDPGEALRAE